MDTPALEHCTYDVPLHFHEVERRPVIVLYASSQFISLGGAHMHS